MSYNIPYDSDYGTWYGTPQNVTRLSAVLEQVLDEEDNPVGLITASWNMPDNGGAFVALLSTDGTNFYVAETGIQGNSVSLTVPANTDFYVKIVTVLGVSQSTGTTSSLLSASVTEIPPTPVVTTVQGGMQIDVGIIPKNYKVNVLIGTDEVIVTNNPYMYLCEPGTYSVSAAYMNESGAIGTYSTATTVTVDSVVMLGFLTGANTFERDGNGDVQPCENPQPSLFWDIDSNGDIMPSELLFKFDGNGDIMPV